MFIMKCRNELETRQKRISSNGVKKMREVQRPSENSFLRNEGSYCCEALFFQLEKRIKFLQFFDFFWFMFYMFLLILRSLLSIS